MEVSYGEGVASHTGPESCAVAREVVGEALPGECAGRVSSRESSGQLRGADAAETGGGHTERVASARRERTLRGLRPRARTETLRMGTGRSHVRLRLREPQATPGSPRTQSGDGRTWEVGRPRSTWEAAEQSRETGGGGSGGKGTDQGELARAQRAPDTEPGRCAKRARASTSGNRKGEEAAVHGAPASRLRH